VGLRVPLLVVLWIIAAVILRMRGERFWRSVIQGLFVSFGVYFAGWLAVLGLAMAADSLG